MKAESNQNFTSQLENGIKNLQTALKDQPTPSLRAVIDYCNLHQTTGDESYRLRAVDCMRNYEKLMRLGDNLVSKPVEVVYTEVLKTLGVDDPAPFLGMLKMSNAEMAPLIDGLEKVVDMLRERNDFAPLHEWRDHCIRCSAPGDSKCHDNVQRLETRYQQRLTDLESAWDGLLEAARPYVGKLTKEAMAGNLSGLGLPSFGRNPSMSGLRR